MNSDKQGAIHLTAVLKKKGLRHVVICPGSRNAPLIISLTSDSFFTCYSMVDERSASFFALGLSQIEKNYVAIICTSGSALLNMAPAVAEAYYQRLPLVVISADRPLQWVNQGESQTMQQAGVFKNYIRAEIDLPQEPKTPEELRLHDQGISDVLDKSLIPFFGPVHINIRFEEPLYGQSNEIIDVHLAESTNEIFAGISNELEQELKSSWNKHDKVLIICGQMFPDEELNNTLDQLSKKGVVVLTESISNLRGDDFIPFIDKIIIPSSKEEKKKLKPDLLISIGGPLISRKIKNYLRTEDNIEHWHIDSLDPEIDAYAFLKHGIKERPNNVLSKFINETNKSESYLEYWLEFRDHVEKNGTDYLKSAGFSDLKAFDLILSRLPENLQLHVGNSASIRYAQLLQPEEFVTSYSNRGISGIEGCVSTAVGSSVNFSGTTLLITGDLSALYDSNALWNKYLSPKFKMIVINNGGGGIFKIIEGPKSVDKFEEFIETKHNRNFGKMAELHGLSYYKAENEDSFNANWEAFINDTEKAALFEINTIEIKNEEVLAGFFEYLKREI